MKLPPTIRSIYDFTLHTGVQKRHSASVVPTGVSTTNSDPNQPSTSEGDQGRASLGDPAVLPYVFHPDRPPATRQIIYQLCDIHCAEAQKVISANDGKVGKRFVR